MQKRLGCIYKTAKQKQKKKIRQIERRAERDLKVKFKVVTSRDEFDMVYQKLVDFNIKLSKNKHFISSYSSARFNKFHKRVGKILLKKNRLFMTYLLSGAKIIAVNHAFIYNNKIYDYNGGYSSIYKYYSPGVLLFIKSLRCAIENYEINEWDFTKGEANYKERWGKFRRQNLTYLCGYSRKKQTMYIAEIQFKKEIAKAVNYIMSKKLKKRFKKRIRKKVYR